MRRIRQRPLFLALAALSVISSACSTTTQTVSAEGASSIQDARFGNFLVIGVATNYEARSRFERKLASDLRGSGVAATALYVSAGGNKPTESYVRSTLLSLRNPVTIQAFAQQSRPRSRQLANFGRVVCSS